jgi:hypothetical protein
MKEVKSIDTFYNGNYHRSRLEARWAVFFNELGVKYQYEPEGFQNEKGEKYLPDFFLPDTFLRDEDKGVYLEIKPDSFDRDDIDASTWFNKNLVLFKGGPLNNTWNGDGADGFQLAPWWDNCMQFWICNNCKVTKIEFAEGNYDRCPVCGGSCDVELLNRAAAKSAYKRFEHGAT